MNILAILLLPGALLTSKALSSAAVINCVAQFVVFVVTAQVYLLSFYIIFRVTFNNHIGGKLQYHSIELRKLENRLYALTLLGNFSGA